MEVQEFLTTMAEDILVTNQELTMETVLSDVDEWDSLAVVSFAAMADSNGRLLGRDNIKTAKTIRDLYDMLNE